MVGQVQLAQTARKTGNAPALSQIMGQSRKFKGYAAVLKQFVLFDRCLPDVYSDPSVQIPAFTVVMAYNTAGT